MLHCSDFPDAHCCGSCHEDEELFGYEMLEVEVPGKLDENDEPETACVCCAIATWIEDNIK